MTFEYAVTVTEEKKKVVKPSEIYCSPDAAEKIRGLLRIKGYRIIAFRPPNMGETWVMNTSLDLQSKWVPSSSRQEENCRFIVEPVNLNDPLPEWE